MKPKHFKYNKILVLSDNIEIAEEFIELIKKLELPNNLFSFKCSKNSFIIKEHSFEPIIVKDNINFIINNFNLLLSLHCTQIIPTEIVNSIKCINIHPGFNPYNRGWFPHIFSIINKLPAGASLHEMNEKIDCGPIIAQKQYIIETHDTSLSVYNKIKALEIKLLEENLIDILNDNYNTFEVYTGNINYKKDFENLCLIDLDEITNYKKAIDKLRALSHGDYNNAYFIDEESGKKIFVKIELTPESS